MRSDPQTAAPIADRLARSQRFLRRMRPALAERSADRLAEVAKEHYDCPALRELAATGSTDARRVACLALGLIGCDDCVNCLADALHDDDPVVADLAEQALWSIWFRIGSDEAMPAFREGVAALDAGAHGQAIREFTHALALDPQFPEARNQRALAAYLHEDWSAALVDCEQVVRAVPEHFGAWAGAGHSYAHLGQLHRAAAAYRQALEINPRMHAIRGALRRIEARLGQ